MNRRTFITYGIALISGHVCASPLKTYGEDSSNEMKDFFKGDQTIIIPKGDYYIGSEPIKLHSDTDIIFEDGVNIYIVEGYKYKTLFEIDNKKQIRITGGVFHAVDDTCSVIEISNASSSIYLEGMTCSGLRLASVNNKDAEYFSLNNNIKIKDCNGIAREVKTKKAFVEMRYTNISDCIGCNVTGFYHGLLFWGGDANPKHSQDRQRKCENINIKNNNVKNVIKGGIWGSMADSVVIENNHVENGGDVGIDFEGCNNCVAVNNKVKDFKNGCLATFFTCSNILFENNTILCSDENEAAAIFNSSQRRNNKNITYKNNSFVSNNGLAKFSQHGAVDNLVLQNNSFVNILIKLDSNNNGDIKFDKNKFSFSITPQNTIAYIEISNINKPSAIISFVNNIVVVINNSSEKIDFLHIDVKSKQQASVIIENNTSNSGVGIKSILNINDTDTNSMINNNSNMVINTMAKNK